MTDKPAFPNEPAAAPDAPGSLRDYFAAAAMQGLIDKYELRPVSDAQGIVSVGAYLYADAMLAERTKERGTQ